LIYFLLLDHARQRAWPRLLTIRIDVTGIMTGGGVPDDGCRWLR
jgi:hypothetical protein